MGPCLLAFLILKVNGGTGRSRTGTRVNLIRFSYHYSFHYHGNRVCGLDYAFTFYLYSIYITLYKQSGSFRLVSTHKESTFIIPFGSALPLVLKLEGFTEFGSIHYDISTIMLKLFKSEASTNSATVPLSCILQSIYRLFFFQWTVKSTELNYSST